MREDNREPDASGAPKVEEEIAPTPFDHPLFFPALMLAALVWFGYDGWINADYQPGGDKHESQAFSRWGAGVLVLLVVYYGYRGLEELREIAEKSNERS